MNSPVRTIMTGETLRPGEGLVTVVGNRSVFGQDRVLTAVEAGATVAEILDRVWPGRDGQPAAVYLLRDGLAEIVIAEARWPRVRPKPGTTLAFKAIAHGKNARIIGLIAVAVAAIIVAPYLAGPILGLTGTALAIGTGLIAAGITIGGTLAVNALFPVRPPRIAPQANAGTLPDGSSVSSRKTVYSIAGAQNQARPFGAIPVVLGRHRLYPPYAARPYTELLGDDVFLRLLFCVGYGPLDISDLKIGETPIAQFTDVEVEIRNGYADDAAVSLYPFSTHEDSLQILLKGGITETRVTQPDTDLISVDITAPQGVFAVDPAIGKRVQSQTTVNVLYALVTGGPVTELGAVTFDLEEQTARRGLAVQVPRGQYNVYVGRQTADTNSSNVSDQVYWTALRSFTFERPTAFDAPLALVAMRIKANGQLNGTVDNFNVVAASRVKAYNGVGAWVDDTVSRNPADLYRHVLQGPANKRPAVDAAIDIVNLQDFWTANALAGFTFDAVIENADSVYTVLADIAAAGRGRPVRPDGRWGVIWDRFDAPVAQHFSPRNSWGFSGQKVFRRAPHGLRCRFVNADQGYTADERIVYDDGFDETNATLFEAVEFHGCTSSEVVWKDGRYHIAQARLRPELYTLSTNWQHLRCNVGDRVRAMSDVAGWGQISGRVKAVAGAIVTVDETITMEAGKSYVARFRLADGTTLLRMIVFAIGEATGFVLDDAGDAAAGNPVTKPAVGDLMAGFGEAGDNLETVVLRVFSIQHQKDLVATLVLVDDAPALADIDQGEIPDFDTHISAPVDPFALPPFNLAVTEIIDGSGAAKSVRVRLAWQAPRMARVSGFEAQARNDVLGPTWGPSKTVAAPQTFVDFPDVLLGAWSFRVRSIFDDGKFSDWATLLASQITGIHLSSPLPDVTFLHQVFRSRVTNIDWTEVQDFRQPVYEIRKGDTWASALTVAVSQAHPPYPVLGDDTYWVAAVATPVAGLTVYSANPQSIVVGGAQLVENVVLSFDQAALDWPGIYGGTLAKSGVIIRTGGAGNILSDSDFLGNPDILNFGGGGDGTYQIPLSEVIDIGRIAECAISITLAAAGARSDQNILVDPDFLANPDILDTAASRFVEVYAEIRTATNDPFDFFQGGDPAADVFLGGAPGADVFAEHFFWGPWERWSSGVKSCRGVDARLVFRVLDPTVYAYATQFVLTIDVPDRLDHYAYTSNPAGDAIVYTPDLGSAPAVFNGGPNGAPTPLISHALIDGVSGDRVTVTGETAAGCTVRVFNAAGAGVARKVNLLVQGF